MVQIQPPKISDLKTKIKAKTNILLCSETNIPSAATILFRHLKRSLDNCRASNFLSFKTIFSSKQFLCHSFIIPLNNKLVIKNFFSPRSYLFQWSRQPYCRVREWWKYLSCIHTCRCTWNICRENFHLGLVRVRCRPIHLKQLGGGLSIRLVLR